VARDTSHLVWNENNNVVVTSCWDSGDVEWELSRLGALATIEEREERERGRSSRSRSSGGAASSASSSAASPAASSAVSSRRHPLPHICVAGESNSGKSSLLNHLLRKNNMARASSVAGKTRSVDLMTVNDGVVLADLPGLPSRDHQVERIWAKVITRLRAFHMPRSPCHMPHSNDG
jgi:putative ribosome biogenesis GTPase RsgA